MLSQIPPASLLVYFPIFLSGTVFAAIIFAFLRRREKLARYTGRFFVVLIVLRILYALLLSVLQYGAWLNNLFSQYLLPPHQSLSYFLAYSGMHFWLNLALSLLTALLAFGFFGVLRKINAGWFLGGEVSLGVLLTFLLGWPLALFLVPMSFFVAAVLSAVYMLMKREQRVSLGGIMLGVAGTLSVVFGIFFYSHTSLGSTLRVIFGAVPHSG